MQEFEPVNLYLLIVWTTNKWGFMWRCVEHRPMLQRRASTLNPSKHSSWNQSKRLILLLIRFIAGQCSCSRQLMEFQGQKTSDKQLRWRVKNRLKLSLQPHHNIFTLIKVWNLKLKTAGIRRNEQLWNWTRNDEEREDRNAMIVDTSECDREFGKCLRLLVYAKKLE